ncbi:hypothetical protein BGX33_000840, partial [Mortierella sp. NVP41]
MGLKPKIREHFAGNPNLRTDLSTMMNIAECLDNEQFHNATEFQPSTVKPHLHSESFPQPMDLDAMIGSTKVAPSAGSADALAKAYKQDVLSKLYEAEETFRKDLEAVEKTLDPLIRQYKVKALDMTLAPFEKYRQRAISARFIVISTQSSISSASSTATTTDSISTKESSRNDGRPLDSSDISWKLLPKWDANWKKERNFEAFLKNMSNFRTMMEEAQDWNEMQTRFKDWQAPPLDELIQQAIEEQRLHPQDTGTG